MRIWGCIKNKINKIKEVFKNANNQNNICSNFIKIIIKNSEKRKFIDKLNVRIAFSIYGLLLIYIFYDAYIKESGSIGIGTLILIIIIFIFIPCIHFYLVTEQFFGDQNNIGVLLEMDSKNVEVYYNQINTSIFTINRENFDFYNDINIRLKGYILNIKEHKNNKQINKNWAWIFAEWIFTVIMVQVLGYYLKNISIESFNANIMNIISIIILFGMIIFIISDINLILKDMKRSRENKINSLLVYIHVELESKIKDYIANKNIKNKEKVILNNEKWVYVNNE